MAHDSMWYRSLTAVLVAAALLLMPLAAADSGKEAALADFREAMADGDGTAKKKALQQLARYGDDVGVQKVLAGVVEDRQVGRLAIKTLASKTGNSSATTAAEWNTWLAEQKQREAEEAEKQALEEKVAQLEEQTAAEDGTDAEGADGATDGQEDGYMTPDEKIDLGKLDRVFFNDGTVMSCYIMLKRVDLDGNLTSLRIMHKNRSGEEVVGAHLISHIEEDYK